MPHESTWPGIAKERQAYRDASIAAVKPPIPPVDTTTLPLNVFKTVQSLLLPPEVEITETDPLLLLQQLATGKISAVAVTNAFLRRAAVVQKLTNCITELLPSLALARAAQLDAHLSSTGKPIGPLHGLPISIKEHLHLSGHDCNAAFCGWVGRTATEDAAVLKPLYEAGCVFYARTTQPQTLMQLETGSNLFGETVCGFNRGLTSGGSSGGEGALVGMRGSLLGVGTDIGGSIRSPAANNGLYGLKPTGHRLPMGGQSATMLGQEHITAVCGPITHSLPLIPLFMSTVLSSEPWKTDPSLIPIPWRDDSYFPINMTTMKTKKIKIGVMSFDGVVMPHPPVLRGIKEVVEKLKKFPDEFEIVEWEEKEAERAWDIISSLYFADGATEELTALSLTSEPLLPLSSWVISQPGVPPPPGHSIQRLWELTIQRDEFRNEYNKKWRDRGVDVILSPVGPGVAPKLGTAKYWGYTSLWNLLDYPAVVFPVGRVDKEKDAGKWGYEGVGERDRENVALWNPETFKDAPISLQLVGQRFDDEKIIEALTIIQGKIGLPFVDLTKS